MQRSFAQVVLAQVVVLVASLVKALVIPKILSVDGFAFWQVYVLYSGFVGVFALGYSDGVYLRFGGCDWDRLPFRELRASNRIYFFVLVAFSVVLGICSLCFLEGPKSFAMFFVAADIAVVGMSGLLLYLLQVTNQIKQYSLYSAFDKVLMLVLILAVVAFAIPDYRIFIICDFLAKAAVALALVFSCRDVLFGVSDGCGLGFKAYLGEVKIGFSLLVANLAGMLAVGAGRFVVEIFGQTADYAYYSLGISVTNLVLTFVGACALVIYPNLKRMDKGSLRPFFGKVSAASGTVSSLGLLAYWPVAFFVSCVFPRYEPLLAYLALLFLAVVGQVRMQLLCNTYYKALRMERDLLRVNLSSVALAGLLAGVSYFFTHDVWWVAFVTAATMLGRAWLSEWGLRKRLSIESVSSLVAEVVACVGFFAATAVLDGWGECVALTIIGASGFAFFLLMGRREAKGAVKA